MTGFVLAWILRLRRPWLVPPLGLLFSCLFTWATAHISEDPIPGWGSATVLALAFAAAALVPLAFSRTSRDASPAGTGEGTTPAGPVGQA